MAKITIHSVNEDEIILSTINLQETDLDVGKTIFIDLMCDQKKLKKEYFGFRAPKMSSKEGIATIINQYYKIVSEFNDEEKTEEYAKLQLVKYVEEFGSVEIIHIDENNKWANYFLEKGIFDESGNIITEQGKEMEPVIKRVVDSIQLDMLRVIDEFSLQKLMLGILENISDDKITITDKMSDILMEKETPKILKEAVYMVMDALPLIKNSPSGNKATNIERFNVTYAVFRNCENQILELGMNDVSEMLIGKLEELSSGQNYQKKILNYVKNVQ